METPQVGKIEFADNSQRIAPFMDCTIHNGANGYEVFMTGLAAKLAHHPRGLAAEPILIELSREIRNVLNRIESLLKEPPTASVMNR